MENRIKKLFNLCKEQPFDLDKINDYIHNNNMNAEEVTRTALELCDYASFSYSDYCFCNKKEASAEELITYNWEALFNVLIANGLDANLVICDNGIDYENILQSIRYLDDADLNARVLRNILSNGGTPDIKIGDETFFEEVDAHFIIDIQLELYTHKWQLDNAFRFWLVLIGFGGVINNGELPVNMCNGKTPEIFKDFEKFDYDIIRTDDDFNLFIIEKETGTIVAKM